MPRRTRTSRRKLTNLKQRQSRVPILLGEAARRRQSVTSFILRWTGVDFGHVSISCANFSRVLKYRHP
jgi:hypothetical protein